MKRTSSLSRTCAKLAAVFALAAFCMTAMAAEIQMRTGEVIRGLVLRVESDSITVKTQYGTIVIPEADVVKIVYESAPRPDSEPKPVQEREEVGKNRETKDYQAPVPAYKRRSDWFVPFSYSSTGFWTIGLGHRGGIADDAYREIELDYGRWATDGWTYEYLLLPVSAVYGKGIGLAVPWWKVQAGLGGRLALGACRETGLGWDGLGT